MMEILKTQFNKVKILLNQNRFKSKKKDSTKIIFSGIWRESNKIPWLVAWHRQPIEILSRRWNQDYQDHKRQIILTLGYLYCVFFKDMVYHSVLHFKYMNFIDRNSPNTEQIKILYYHLTIYCCAMAANIKYWLCFSAIECCFLVPPLFAPPV